MEKRKNPLESTEKEVTLTPTKRVNPISLEEETAAIKANEKVEKTAKIKDFSNVRRGLRFMLLSKVVFQEIQRKYPSVKFGEFVENALLEHLKANDEDTYDRIVKVLKGE